MDALVALTLAAYTNREQFGNKAKAQLQGSVRDLLHAYIAHALTGHTKDTALHSLEDAASKFASGIRDAMGAETCLAATETIYRYLSIPLGRRQARETIKELCERFMQETPGLGATHVYSIQALAKMPIAKVVASELTVNDVNEHVRRRRNEGVAPSTVAQDLTFLRGVFVAARDRWKLDVSTDPIDHAKHALRKAGLVAASKPRDRRPTRQELQSLVDYFAESEKHARAKLPMRDIMEFALWSARRIGEICSLRWEDLDKTKKTCIVRVTDARGNVRSHEFPLLGKAFDVVMRQPEKKGEPRIFPYGSKSASTAYSKAKAKLGIENLRFQDLRREAAIRLHEAGHSIEQIAKVTGRMDLNSLLRDIGARPTQRDAGAEGKKAA